MDPDSLSPQNGTGVLFDHDNPNDKSGLGIDIDEKLAAEYPCQDQVEQWTRTRLPDGSPARP
jgi:hypothetical protein